MARYLFGSDLFLTTTAPPVVQLAPNATFTLWSDRVGGSQYTDCTAPDGTSALTTSNGSFVADGTGQRPAMRGPDGVVLMWVDSGSSTRYPMYAADLLQSTLNASIGWLSGALGIITRTAAQGVPTAADCAAAGYPDGTLITVDPA